MNDSRTQIELSLYYRLQIIWVHEINLKLKVSIEMFRPKIESIFDKLIILIEREKKSVIN